MPSWFERRDDQLDVGRGSGTEVYSLCGHTLPIDRQGNAGRGTVLVGKTGYHGMWSCAVGGLAIEIDDGQVGRRQIANRQDFQFDLLWNWTSI